MKFRSGLLARLMRHGSFEDNTEWAVSGVWRNLQNFS